MKRVKAPDKDDWNKLVRTLQYIKATIHMKLTLKINAMNILLWFIDSSHQVHEDCKGHTGGGLSPWERGLYSAPLQGRK